MDRNPTLPRFGTDLMTQNSFTINAPERRDEPTLIPQRRQLSRTAFQVRLQRRQTEQVRPPQDREAL
jgi:hypothetical protein